MDLLPAANVTAEMALGHVGMVSLLSGVLCKQHRFDEAHSLLVEQQREFAANGCPPRELLLVEKTLGGALARCGNTAEAVPDLHVRRDEHAEYGIGL